MKQTLFFIGFVICTSLIACKSKEPVKSTTEKKVQPVATGIWNAEDSRIIAEKLVKKMLTDRWRTEYLNVHKNARPILIVGIVVNYGTEKIDTNLFLKDIERSIIKGDLARFVQSGNKKASLLSGLSQSDTLITITSWAKRMGADFVVNSSVYTTQEIKRREKNIQYKVKVELINCETQQLVWLGEEILIKKITE